MIPDNPIRVFINNLLKSGQITKEKICVASDLKFNTLHNIFIRNRVSVMVRKSLLFSGIINKGIYDEYENWFRTVYKPAQKAAKVKGHTKNHAKNKPEGNAKAIHTNP